MSTEKYENEILRFWPGEPAKLCLAIIRSLKELPRNELEMLTFTTLKRAIGKTEIDSDLLTAINILSGSKIALLDARILFIDNDDKETELSSYEFTKAVETGRLVNPNTGEYVENFEDHLLQFFVPTEKFLEEIG